MTAQTPSTVLSSTPSTVLVTVTGRDHPGILARLTGIVAETGAVLLDLEQVVIQGQLTLCLQLGLANERGTLKDLLFAAKELGVSLDFQAQVKAGFPGLGPVLKSAAQRFVVTALGTRIGARELSLLAGTLAEHGGNVERVGRLSEGGLASMEVHLTLQDASRAPALKSALLQLSLVLACDVALQREGLYRRSKRLVVMDMDSTLIRIEVIDELARAHGVVDQVSRITERAMQGEMDFDESLRQRVGLLAGLPVAVLEKLAQELPLTDGAERLVRVLKRLGYRTAVISGGFSIAAEALKARLGIDFAHANVLEVVDGKLTGRVLGPIVNAARKADLLELIAKSEGILLDQVIAVGDGANDLLMLERAGLGVAFRAKPKLREAADLALSASGLDGILSLLGITARELQEINEA